MCRTGGILRHAGGCESASPTAASANLPDAAFRDLPTDDDAVPDEEVPWLEGRLS